MEKWILAWDKEWDIIKDVKAFAVYKDICIISFIPGKVRVVNKFEFDVLNEPITKIYHLKGSLFGIVQSQFWIIEINDSANVVKVLKDKVLGCFQDIIWTKLTVFDLDFKPLYKIKESEGEIVQVCKCDGQLIVSSLVRSVVIGKTGSLQIGKKERNGEFGACEYKNSIYAARPLGNMWQANFQGVVMITTNYKINQEKVNFGCIYKLERFLLSINKKNCNFIVIDPVQLLVVHYESINETDLFYNIEENKLFKRNDDTIYCAKVLTIHEYFSRLLEGETGETVKFVLDNLELHNLNILQPLCVQVFYENRRISDDLFRSFSDIIQKLEENMDLPLVSADQEVAKNDEIFDEFLRLSFIISSKKKTKKKREIDQRVKTYYKKNFVYPMLLNWLLFVIYRFNEKLFKIKSFIRISKKSLDYEKFSFLVVQEKQIQSSIESLL